MQIDGLDANEGDRIRGAEINDGVAMAVVADMRLERGKIGNAVPLYPDDVVLGRGTAYGSIAVIEIVDRVVAGGGLEDEAVVVRPAPKLVIAGAAGQGVGAAGDRSGGRRG